MMKKVGLLFAVFMALCALVVSADYKSDFYASLSQGRYDVADSVLSQWLKSGSADAEYHAARFNLFLNKSRNSMIELRYDTDFKGECLELADSTGNIVAALGEYVEWNDSLFSLAMQAIDVGIETFPDRLDLRFGKATAAGKRGQWATLVNEAEAVLERSVENKFEWYWTDDELLGESAKRNVQEGMYEFLSTIVYEEDSIAQSLAEPFALNIVKAFPDDFRVLNLLGYLQFGKRNHDKALEYFGKALELHPGDGLIALNIAYCHYSKGNQDEAVARYREIEADDKYDEESRTTASEMLRRLAGKFEKIRTYDYFFRYLPSVAGNVEVGAGYVDDVFTDVSSINTKIAHGNDFESPFADSEISAERFDVGQETIYVWTFPEPAESPLCRYVAFVPTGRNYAILTLEKPAFPEGDDELWVVGSSTGSAPNHTSFKWIPRPQNAAAFAKAVYEHGIVGSLRKSREKVE